MTVAARESTDPGSAEPRRLANFVGGRFVETGRWFDDVSPIDGRVVAPGAEADHATGDAALAAPPAARDRAGGPLPGAE
ncbi:MAG: hypothetical protein RID91_18665, partial [Azospirillaceae bacterium]